MDTAYPVSIYIHIPFCTKKCGYCDFYSISGGSGYYSSVLERIILQLKTFIAKNPVIDVYTVYIGGGTPSSLPLNLLESFLSALEDILPSNVEEFTMEANPEDIHKPFLEMLFSHHINRISMGVQSLNESVLKVLERNTSRYKTLKALDCLASNWQENISFDLITSVPGQETADTLRDLQTLLKFSPGHISLYTLTFENGTPLTKKLEEGTIHKVSEEHEAAIFDGCTDYLEDNGYYRYEISNFSSPGEQSLHNKVYWDLNPYFGAGPSAVSTIPFQNKALRIENPRDMKSFLHGNFELINSQSFLLEHLLMGFRLIKGIHVGRIESIFPIDIFSTFTRTIDSWSRNLKFNEGYLSLDRSGLMLLNKFLSDIAAEIPEDLPENYSWPLRS